MPELPEVEGFRKVLQRSLNKKIRTVEVYNKKVLDHVSENQFRNKLAGVTFISAERYGKYLFARSDHDFWVSFHFGMTGFLENCENDGSLDKYARVVFRFEGKSCLSFHNQRLFGRVGLVSSPSSFVSEHNLGPDACSIGKENFLSLLEHGTGIKVLLMNQERIAGIGNEYSDEILFQSGIHPGRKADELSGEQKQQLYGKMRTVLSEAARSRTAGRDLPDGYLIRVRKKGTTCPRCGTSVSTGKFGGRTGYFCPKCQV
ncbi:MAG: Fpg/Nei family DNA glycosylase [Chitinispirillaceae bacterium]